MRAVLTNVGSLTAPIAYSTAITNHAASRCPFCSRSTRRQIICAPHGEPSTR